MTEVPCYIALSVAADHGIAASEPIECFNPTAVVMRAKALSRMLGHVGAVAFSRSAPKQMALTMLNDFQCERNRFDIF
jgi:hypothetical protein